eukprot:107880_1
MGNKNSGACTSSKNKGGRPKQTTKKPIKFSRKSQIPQPKLDRIKITKSLNLEKSKYSSIPSNLFMIENLEIVNLNDNNIKHIDEDIIPSSDYFTKDTDEKTNKKKKHKGIKLLRISNNKLSSLPQ